MTKTPNTAFARIMARFDPGLLLLLALGVFALLPLVERSGLSTGPDMLFHVHRAGEMYRSWAHGVLLPRWAEAFYYGYGSPIFHYYAGFTYYLTSAMMHLTGVHATDAMRLVIVLSFLAGLVGMYRFVRPRHGTAAGVMAALCYVYSPYLLFTEPYARGAYPELLAFGLFPLVMWRFRCLLSASTPVNALLAAVGVTVLILTHNLMALVLGGLLAAWLVWRGVFAGWRSYRLGLALAVVGVGLAAYFWLPVLLERDAVHLENLIGTPELDYHGAFVSLGDLLAFSPRADDGAINGLLHYLNLGVAQWVLALTGLAAVLLLAARRHNGLRRALADPDVEQSLFFALMAVALIFLILPQSSAVWDRVGVLAYLQFPWRLLGPAAFCLAVLAGMNALWITRLPATAGHVLTALLVAAPVVMAFPTLHVPRFEWRTEPVDASTAGYHDLEVYKQFSGATTFSNEYLPESVFVIPDPTLSLIDDFADGYPVDKANRANLPAGVRLELLDHGPQHDTWRVEADEPFTMEVLTFYFLGWQVEIDGQPVPITPSPTHGLITFLVPAGGHTIALFLGATPARNLGNGISALSLLALGVVVFFARRGMQPAGAPGARPGLSFVGGAAGLGGTILLAAVLLHPGGAWLDSPPGEAQLAQHQTAYQLGELFRLIGYDVSGTAFRPGETLRLVLYWYAAQPAAYNYAAFVHVSTGGPPLAQGDHPAPGRRPTREWTADGYIRDVYSITLPETMPPGTYQLVTGLWTCDDVPAGAACGSGRLPVYDDQGSLLGDSVLLGEITIQ